jgi:RNA polymerase sigma-70 factor (ECF subfamily)
MSKLSADLSLELVRATAAGDQIAFAELYRLTSGRLYAIASRMLGNADAAGEALQEAYIRIWTQSGQYVPKKDNRSIGCPELSATSVSIC